MIQGGRFRGLPVRQPEDIRLEHIAVPDAEVPVVLDPIQLQRFVIWLDAQVEWAVLDLEAMAGDAVEDPTPRAAPEFYSLLAAHPGLGHRMRQQGDDGLLVIVALVSWIAWHVLQARGESKVWDEELRMFGDKQPPGEERLDD